MNSNIKTVGTLSLITAIIGTVLAVPLLGSMVNYYNIGTIATVVLAIVILVKSKGTEIKKTASVLTIVSGILGVIGAIVVIIIAGAAISSASTAMTDSEAAGAALGGLAAGGIFGAIFTFPSWIMLIIATVLHYINFSKANKMTDVTEVVIDIQEEIQDNQE